jgi:hypothetical protein
MLARDRMERRHPDLAIGMHDRELFAAGVAEPEMLKLSAVVMQEVTLQAVFGWLRRD